MITTTNLTKRFDGVCALENVTCTIQNGCIYGMVGSNGAGKSTFLRTLSGVYKADSGEVLLDGEPIWENPSAKAKIAYVPDELFYIPSANLKRIFTLSPTTFCLNGQKCSGIFILNLSF
jgi:ABC-2 type transport system ATP-binding protein